MPLLTIFLLIAACMPVEWPTSFLGLDRRGSTIATAVAVLVPLSLAFTLRTWVVVALRRDPLWRSEVGRGYVRLRLLLYYVNIASVLFAVLGLGWGATVQQALAVPVDDDAILPPFAELAVPLPYFLLLFGIWVIYFDAERSLHQTALARPQPFWSRAGYVLHQARQLALFVMLPVTLFVVNQSIHRWLPETSRSVWFQLASIAGVMTIVVLMPVALRPLLGLRPLPDGPTRDRLLAISRRVGFRFRELLVWPTRGVVVNAMILGLFPRVRYVIFTDRILDEMPPDQLDAVFGHEAGHAKHGHIRYYMVFLVLSMLAISAVGLYVIDLIEPMVRIPREYEHWLIMPPVFTVMAYLFLVFGFLSRKCERQADVFGAWAISCGDPHCVGHDEKTRFPQADWKLCPTGLRTFAEALERVHLLNGYGLDAPKGFVRGAFAWAKAWMHGPIPRRVSYLLSLIDRPARERQLQRTVAVVRWGLMAGLITTIIVFGELVGWKNLVQAM